MVIRFGRVKLARVKILLIAVSVIVSLVVSTSSSLAGLMGCKGSNGFPYPGAPGQPGYYFAQVATGSCGDPSCLNYTFAEGVKGNISDTGNPYVYDTSNQNVNEWIAAFENTSDHGCAFGGTCCVNFVAGGQCSIQVGWQIGASPGPTNLAGNCQYISTGETPSVYVEIFDDSASPCTRLAFFPMPPSGNAGFDTRFYSTEPNGLHVYQVFYQNAPNTSYQDLAYGEYVDQHTAIIGAAEVYSPIDGERCPVLGNISQGQWNYHGLPANLFAENMQLWTGYWQPWTPGLVTTVTSTIKPYQLQTVSSYTEWMSGGS